MSALARPAPAAAPDDVPLACADLRKRAGGAKVLDGVDFALARGSAAAVLGPCRAGKSLWLRLALGLERPDGGTVALFGADPAVGPAAARAARLARIGVVFAGGALVEDWSVERNVGFALREVRRRPADEVRRAVRESLLLVGLKHVEHLPAGPLPQGVRRRVALARAVAHRPELLLLDEPAEALDPVGAEALLAVVLQLRERLGLTLLAFTREPRTALRLGERVAVLHAGRLVADAPADALRTSADPAVQQLLAGRAHGPIAP